MKKTILYIIAFVAACNVAWAQTETLEVEINPIQMLIGQQAKLKVTATAKENATVQFPVFKRTQEIVPGVEVLEQTTTEKETVDNQMAKYSQVYTLTSFDDTIYYLPPIEVKVDGKTLKSQSLALKVMTVEVDTLHPEKFFPPNDVQDNPFLWSDWSTPFWMSVLMIFLLAIAYYLYVRLQDNKPIIVPIKAVKRLLPHQKAMNEINLIKAEKMTSLEDPKEYYTRLTDTLRKYMEERFGFNAMEMTSSQIIDQLSKVDDKSHLEELRMLFNTADLVKFAKYSTLINENDANLVNAIEFINQTKLDAMPEQAEQKPKLSAEDQRTIKQRTWLKTTIATILALSAALLIYVGYAIYTILN